MRRIRVVVIALAGLLVAAIALPPTGPSRRPSPALAMNRLLRMEPERIALPSPAEEVIVPIPVVPGPVAGPEPSRDAPIRHPDQSGRSFVLPAYYTVADSTGGPRVPVAAPPSTLLAYLRRFALPTSIQMQFDSLKGYRNLYWTSASPGQISSYETPKLDLSGYLMLRHSPAAPELKAEVQPIDEVSRILKRYRVTVETDPKRIPPVLPERFIAVATDATKFRATLARALENIDPGFVAPYGFVFVACDRIDHPGSKHRYGGTYAFPNHIFIHNHQPDEFIARACVHELSSFWFHHPRFPSAQYRAANPPEFRYHRERHGPEDLSFQNLSLDNSGEWFAKGFASGYATSTLEDDFEELSEFVILRTARCRLAAARHPAFARKLAAWKSCLRATASDESLPVRDHLDEPASVDVEIPPSPPLEKSRRE
jgi:hypothetical protein